jgi:hypothetical protein
MEFELGFSVIQSVVATLTDLSWVWFGRRLCSSRMGAAIKQDFRVSSISAYQWKCWWQREPAIMWAKNHGWGVHIRNVIALLEQCALCLLSRLLRITLIVDSGLVVFTQTARFTSMFTINVGFRPSLIISHYYYYYYYYYYCSCWLGT